MHPLGRYFSGFRLFGAFVSLLVAVWAIQIVFSAQSHSHRAEAHATVARALANLLWQQHGTSIVATADMAPQDLKSWPGLVELEHAITRVAQSVGDVRVRVYNSGGVLVYAGDRAQIGVNHSGLRGFVRASQREVYIDMPGGIRFAPTDGGLPEQEHFTTFVPLYTESGTSPAAVFEIHVRALASESAGIHSYFKFILMALLMLGFWVVLRAVPGGLPRRIVGVNRVGGEAGGQEYCPVNLDPVTGLLNRAGFRRRLTEALARARRSGRSLVLMHLDLDRFRLVNDSLGHDAGDEVLRAAAVRLVDAVRETDLVFRIGGDEFALLVEELERVEDVVLVADRIVTGMARPVTVAGRDVYVTASIGMAVYPKDTEDMDTLISQAGAAMARAKKEGSSTYRYFDDSMNIGAIQHLELETALQTALENRQFELYYQIKVSAGHGRVAGIEALLRWRRPGYGVVSPNDFIPNLERSGLIIPVGRWVMAAAAEQVCRWMAQGMAPLRVSVNISAVQFHAPDFVDMVREVLASTGLPPGLLELELTESVLVEQAEQAMAIMEELKACGLMLSIDDFGVGYSSLSYLKRFPVDYLKVDRSFILDLLEDRKDAAITSAIAGLARSLDIGLVAEGVESRAQAEWLIAQGYDELQGFLYSRPLPAEECARLIHEIEAANRQQAYLA